MEDRERKKRDKLPHRRRHSRSLSPDWRSRPIKVEKLSSEERSVSKRDLERQKRRENAGTHRESHHRRRSKSPDRSSHHWHNRDNRHKQRHRYDDTAPEGTRHRERTERHRRSASEQREGERQWGKKETNKEEENKPKAKPDFGLSGKLAEDTNIFNGVVIKYNEPPEARKAKRRWRLYPFKGDKSLPIIPLHRQSAYLLGRSRLIADIPIDHPSCSKQHAVLQFRLVEYKRDDGTTGRRVRPYIIDLESANGTFVNNKQIDPRCYVELLERDVIKFGFSSREYVILHEESKGEEADDDVAGEETAPETAAETAPTATETAP
ncbi:smad nuclear interacting protein 1-like [Ornithodoros turicata]|uniref:smad nuclear interacting protein 1-like n=1 Tax=Ornithodoros turicata TaxID=34597 RepID=UPI003138A088